VNDWESDPAFVLIKNEFIATFQTRLKELKDLHLNRLSEHESEKNINHFEMLAHKLAGSAASYGFPTLTRIAGAIDDLLSTKKWIWIAGKNDSFPESFILLFEEALSWADQNRCDPIEYLTDPRMQDLICVSEFLRDSTMS
jgi:HPt (histidine-containing phosphotransfer) domain-containing protein